MRLCTETCLRLNHSQLQFVVGGVKTCKKGFVWSHGFAEGSFNKVHAQVNKEYKCANPKPVSFVPSFCVILVVQGRGENVGAKVKINSQTHTGNLFLMKWLIAMAHNPPNAENPAKQISRIAPSTLYQQYTKWCSEVREVPLQEDGFRGMFSTMLKQLNMVMRTSKKGSAQCWLCALLKEFLAQTPRLVDKSSVQQLIMEHQRFHAAETHIYEQQSMEGKDSPDVLSINSDGAASHAHSLPKVEGRAPKDLPEWPQKLQGVLVHGKTLCLYNLLHLIKSGGNMMLTTLLRTFQHLESSLPRKVYLRVDGGSENWNECVFAVVDLLFDMYPELTSFICHVSRWATHMLT